MEKTYKQIEKEVIKIDELRHESIAIGYCKRFAIPTDGGYEFEVKGGILQKLKDND